MMVCMTLYYLYRMFALTPWYDELYTYYFFISRGPVYAAIHWPLPNNHVGYSVLSGVLNCLGNPYIGLRGVSFLCALANLALLFGIGRRYLKRGLSLAAVLFYLSMNLVNQLAVQGRGYTLGITCYLLSFFSLIRICGKEKAGRRYYVLFALSLVLGLYTLTSDVYWVLPVCTAGGIYLLYQGLLERKEKREPCGCPSLRKLAGLVGASLAAAVMTLGLYGIIWLAIGSNLLVKEEGSGFFGMGHVEVILKAPLKAIGTGMDYMLATPYIQSVERAGFLGRFGEWILNLFNWYYDGLPYYRVFAYGGVLLCFLLVLILQQFGKDRAGALGILLSLALAFFCFGFRGYQNQYSMREYEIQDALSHGGIDQAQNLCVTDCTQQYLMKFLYDITCENTQIEGAELVLLDKRMLDPGFEEMVWEFYHYYDTIPWDYMEDSMEPVYENESFVLYRRSGR